MFIRVKDKPNGKKSVQVVETYRRGDKVHQKIVRHIGQAVTEEEVNVLKKLGESIIVNIEQDRQPVLPLFAPEDIYGAKNKEKDSGETVSVRQEIDDKVKVKNIREEQRIIEGVGDVFGRLYSELGFGRLIGEKRSDERWNEILKNVVIARIANPVSKLRTASLLEEDYGIKIPLENIYRLMDKVALKEDEIKRRVGASTISLFGGKVRVLLFDVTTLYFESVIIDEIKNFGFSKDCKFNQVQVVLALVTTEEGLPITYELFSGNIHEGHTLINIVKELKKSYEVEEIVLVADRAMFEEENLKLMEKEEIKYIVACKLKKLPKAMKKNIIESADYKIGVVDNKVHWVKEYEHNSRRLIVSYNSDRAKKDAADRQRLIELLMKRSKDGKIKLKELISNYGKKKYIELENKEVKINEDKISEEAKWDGLHGVITNKRDGSVSEILSRYGGLWQIEEAFRINKYDLKMRPIYHWTPRRIKAHISICFLAFSLAKQAVYRMKTQKMAMSFEQLRNELLHVQASLVTDIETKKRYVIPSHVTLNQKNIYQVFGLKRSEVPYAL